MPDETKIDDQSGVDRALVAMFLRMSPEERLGPTITLSVEFWS